MPEKVTKVVESAIGELLDVVVVAPEVRVENRRVGTHLGGRASYEVLALVHDRNDVTDLHDELHIVFHNEKGLTLRIERLNFLTDDVNERQVHPTSGLIEQDDVRVRHE